MSAIHEFNDVVAASRVFSYAFYSAESSPPKTASCKSIFTPVNVAHSLALSGTACAHDSTSCESISGAVSATGCDSMRSYASVTVFRTCSEYDFWLLRCSDAP